MPLHKKTHRLLVIIPLVSLILIGCGRINVENEPSKFTPHAQLPDEVLNAPQTVQQAYQFAVANPDVLTQIPCYCGCGAMGHTSNYACYVSGQNEDGSVQFDNHALGCSICVDITLDTMRLMNTGKPVEEIRTYIDNTYAQYGPSNIP